VPSGVWAASEYAKLPDYDAPTFEQPPAAFFCHQKAVGDEGACLCRGWVGTHDMVNSLGLRMALIAGAIDEDTYRAAIDYVSPVPLFESGAEAAAHGIAEIEQPSDKAQRTVEKIARKRPDARYGS
jgi:hypothetical protein